MSTTTIRVSKETKMMISQIGAKNESYDDIICKLFHQRNMMLIHSLCKGQYLDDGIVTLKERCETVFWTIKFTEAPYYLDCGINGDNTIKQWNSFEDCLNWAVEIATDEDLIGSNDRKISMGEAVTNVYCLMNDIPAPTWNIGAMKNPFAL